MSQRNLSLFGLLIGVASIVTLLLRHSLFAIDLFAQAVQVLSFSLMVWARVTFGRRSFHASALPTEGGLVTTGPYRYIRHPIYTSIICFVWAGVLSNCTPTALALGALLTAGMLMRIVAEERLVRVRYPEYGQYAERTKRIIPYIF
ncbi:MAG TPA: isoprenylcysteine carboxylmethyltransferase family protein [Bacteroidota bacterium]|nr:isoprenylcysteine carboxylmethyltransferase family protein [Bacteroidota bacterium]